MVLYEVRLTDSELTEITGALADRAWREAVPWLEGRVYEAFEVVVEALAAHLRRHLRRITPAGSPRLALADGWRPFAEGFAHEAWLRLFRRGLVRVRTAPARVVDRVADTASELFSPNLVEVKDDVLSVASPARTPRAVVSEPVGVRVRNTRG